MSKNKKSAVKVIAHAIQKDENGVRQLLKRNGVDTALVIGKNQLTKVFIEALAKSKRLAIEFGKYIQAKRESFNASGREPVSTVNVLQPVGINPVNIPQQTTTSTTTSSDSGNSGFFDGLTLADLINTTVGVLEIQRDIEVSKNERDAITSAVDVERDKIKLQPQSQSNNTVLYASMAIVGLLAVGTIVYFVKKK